MRAASSPLPASTTQETPAAIPKAAAFAFQTVIKTVPNPRASNHSQSTRKPLKAVNATTTAISTRKSTRIVNCFMVMPQLVPTRSRSPSQASVPLSQREQKS